MGKYQVRRMQIGKTEQLDDLASMCGKLYSEAQVFFWQAYTERIGRHDQAREAKVQQVMQAMQHRGEHITGERLAHLAQVDTMVARAYAQAHRDTTNEALLAERDGQR